MKYISIIVLLAAFQINATAQKISESNVPDAVKTNFSTMLKTTTVTQWELIDGNYAAHYVLSGTNCLVLYKASGEFIHYENAITANEIPEEARKYITTNLPEKKMGNMVRVKTITGEVSYKIEIGGNNYLFDRIGTFVKTEK